MSKRRNNIERLKNLKFEKKVAKGDVNNDGKVDEKDLSIVHKEFAKAKAKKKKKKVKKEK
jgi:hypothetical protein